MTVSAGMLREICHTLPGLVSKVNIAPVEEHFFTELGGAGKHLISSFNHSIPLEPCMVLPESVANPFVTEGISAKFVPYISDRTVISMTPFISNPLMEKIAIITDLALRKDNDLELPVPLQRTFGHRDQVCGFASDMAVHLANRLGFDEAKAFQINELHYTLSERPDSEAFVHGVAWMKKDNKSYLVDLSVEQFIDPVDGSIVEGGRYTGKHISDYPVLQTLYDQGYVEATPENVSQYLGALSHNLEPEYPQLFYQKLSKEPQLLSQIDGEIPDWFPDQLDKQLQKTQIYMQDNGLARTGSVNNFV